jgi:TorA maturation chaperone TorD
MSVITGTARRAGNRVSGPPPRADFYLCLARAFLPPREAAMFEAMSRWLAGDLEALARGVAYPVEADIAAYAEAIAGVPDGEALLQAYSGLFLVPPAPAPLNAALYLDGSVNGPAASAIERAYRDAGVERDARFGDLADHVACQLEFVALLIAREAAGEPPAREVSAAWFLDGFVSGWAPGLRAAIDAAVPGIPGAAVYAALARLLERAVAHDLRSYRRPVDPAEVRRAELARRVGLGAGSATAL